MLRDGLDKVPVTMNISNDNALSASVSYSSIDGQNEIGADEYLALENLIFLVAYVFGNFTDQLAIL